MVLFVAAFKRGGAMSVLYPIYASTFIWAALIAWLAFHEPIRAGQHRRHGAVDRRDVPDGLGQVTMDQDDYAPERRPLASRERKASKAVAHWLAVRGVSPNAISLAGMIAGIAAGLALAATSRC